MQDLELILTQCKKGDHAAQEALYRWLAPKLLGISLRYMQQREEAEDVMQDAFVKIFTNISSFRNEGSFEGWAKRITVHTALNALKKKKRIIFDHDLIRLQQIDFQQEEVQSISIEDVLSCMNLLPAGYRTIINLFVIEEYSHKEIAESLNIGESTSRSQYVRARQALMKLIKDRTIILQAKNA